MIWVKSVLSFVQNRQKIEKKRFSMRTAPDEKFRLLLRESYIKRKFDIYKLYNKCFFQYDV